MSSPHWHVSSSLTFVTLKCLSFPWRCHLTERSYWTLLPMDNFLQQQIIFYVGTGPKKMAYGTKFLMLVRESPTHNKLATCKRNHVTVITFLLKERQFTVKAKTALLALTVARQLQWCWCEPHTSVWTKMTLKLCHSCSCCTSVFRKLLHLAEHWNA